MSVVVKPKKTYSKLDDPVPTCCVRGCKDPNSTKIHRRESQRPERNKLLRFGSTGHACIPCYSRLVRLSTFGPIEKFEALLGRGRLAEAAEGIEPEQGPLAKLARRFEAVRVVKNPPRDETIAQFRERIEADKYREGVYREFTAAVERVGEFTVDGITYRWRHRTREVYREDPKANKGVKKRQEQPGDDAGCKPHHVGLPWHLYGEREACEVEPLSYAGGYY
jgi:hypothetical protein